MSFSYPNNDWWNEATEYSDSFDETICCPVCTWAVSSDSEEVCSFCNQEIECFNQVINVSFLIKNIEKMKALDDSIIEDILISLKKLTYSCPECSSIDDELYHCTSCEGVNISEAERLIKEVIEKHNDFDFAHRIDKLI